MADPRREVDLEGYVRSKVRIHNDNGGFRYDRGVRIFDCPMCDDRKARGWVNLEFWRAGCHNAGCQAEPTLQGGAVEWVRAIEGFSSRGAAWALLYREFKLEGEQTYQPPRAHEPTEDWVRFPADSRTFDLGGGHFQSVFEKFMSRQWNIGALTARAFGLRWSMTGPYAWRIVIPIIMNDVPVAFQARTIHKDGDPKYKTSMWGPEVDPEAECGRPARELLFNVDALQEGGEALLVEGPGDVMGWHAKNRARTPIALGLLGVALTPEKLGLLKVKQPSMVTVALDAEPKAQQRALQHLKDLTEWGLPARLGEWQGSKDAGSGATLGIAPEKSLGDELRERRLLRSLGR